MGNFLQVTFPNKLVQQNFVWRLLHLCSSFIQCPFLQFYIMVFCSLTRLEWLRLELKIHQLFFVLLNQFVNSPQPLQADTSAPATPEFLLDSSHSASPVPEPLLLRVTVDKDWEKSMLSSWKLLENNAPLNEARKQQAPGSAWQSQNEYQVSIEQVEFFLNVFPSCWIWSKCFPAHIFHSCSFCCWINWMLHFLRH